MPSFVSVAAQIGGENRNEGSGQGPQYQKLKNGIRQNKSGKVSVQMGLTAAEETASQQTISDESQNTGGSVGNHDDESGGKNAGLAP
jgi:hypothetical protein